MHDNLEKLKAKFSNRCLSNFSIQAFMLIRKQYIFELKVFKLEEPQTQMLGPSSKLFCSFSFEVNNNRGKDITGFDIYEWIESGVVG